MRGSSDPDGGEAIIPHAPDLGDTVVGFNSAYLVDLGKVFGGEVSMNYDAHNPVLFRSDAMPEFVAVLDAHAGLIPADRGVGQSQCRSPFPTQSSIKRRA